MDENKHIPPDGQDQMGTELERFAKFSEIVTQVIEKLVHVLH